MLVFRWDTQKAERNQRKHGILFEDAVHVFEDPFAISEIERIVEGEVRFQTLGRVGDILILLVAHTSEESGPDEIIRIISARRATKGERERYGQNRYKNPG